MAIAAFIRSTLVQKAVYWGNPQNNGYGGMTFDDPVEIDCRWEQLAQILGTVTGNQVVGYQDIPRAVIFVDQVLDEEGMIYLGTLDDIANLDDSSGDSSGGWYDPQKIVGAYIVKRFKKIPAVRSTTEYLYVGYLTPWLT